MADSFILLIILAAVAAFLLYPIWKKRCGSSCTTTPGTPSPSSPSPNPGPTCFGTPSTLNVIPGILDLSACTDSVYIIRNPAVTNQVKFILPTTC